MSRHYGIDLLKICAMVMVVMHHFVKPFLDKGVDYELGVSGLLLQYLQAFSFCAVNGFIMASGFVMCNRTWKWKRIFELWCQVVFYSILLVSVAYVGFPDLKVGIRDVAGAIMPVSFRRYWFVTQYVALFFTIPVLNGWLRTATEKEKQYVIVAGLGLLSFASLIAGKDLFFVHFGFSYVWFMYCYLVGGIVASSPDMFARVSNRWLVTALLVAVTVAVAGERIGHFLAQTYHVGGRFSELYCNYASPCLFLEALLLLLIFSRLKQLPVFLEKMCKLVAPSVFVVYIVHCNREFYGMTNWSELLSPLTRWGAGVLVLTIIFCALSMFGIIVAIDLLRRKGQAVLSGMFQKERIACGS